MLMLISFCQMIVYSFCKYTDNYLFAPLFSHLIINGKGCHITKIIHVIA